MLAKLSIFTVWKKWQKKYSSRSEWLLNKVEIRIKYGQLGPVRKLCNALVGHSGADQTILCSQLLIIIFISKSEGNWKVAINYLSILLFVQVNGKANCFFLLAFFLPLCPTLPSRPVLINASNFGKLVSSSVLNCRINQFCKPTQKAF